MDDAQGACEICGALFHAHQSHSYTRSTSGRSAVVTTALKRCSKCGRRGCPGCLRVVEEQADDYFLDVYACRDCLEGAGPPRE